MKTPRILLVAYQCAPGRGSVSQIGWEWYLRMSRRAEVTLVTHARNRQWLEAAGAPLLGSEVIYIDTEWFAGPIYSLSRRMFPNSEHSVFLLSSLDFFVFDREVLKQLYPRREQWDLVHLVTPVSPSAHSQLGRLGLPVVRGPLNGGLKTPPNFPEYMKADSAWLYSVRDLAKPLRSILGGPKPAMTLSANRATDEALSSSERSHSSRMPEIAVDSAFYSAAAWPAAPSATNPLRVLFVGRLIPAKALPLLLRAAEEVAFGQEVEVTVIGDGPMRMHWENITPKLNVKVHFLGACDAEQVNQELAKCHVFCLPSVRESGGAVLLEAMAAARPVIAVNYGGPAELVTDRVGCLVDSQSPESVVNGIANALRQVVSDPDQWRLKGVEGRRHVCSQHSWDRRIEGGFEVYSTIVRESAMTEAA